MTRLYTPSQITSGLHILSEPQSHYVQVVLRKKIGDSIKLFNETNGEWNATISQITKRAVTVNVENLIRQPIKLIERFLAFAPIKHDALGFLAEKITELGVTHVQPIITEYTQVHKFPAERFQKQMVDAAQQCERFDIPQLYPPKKLNLFLKEMPSHIKFYAALERTSRPEIELNKTQPMGFIIGPEGGFSPHEKNLLLNHSNLKPISLGSLILRAETASIACLSKTLY